MPTHRRARRTHRPRRRRHPRGAPPCNRATRNNNNATTRESFGNETSRVLPYRDATVPALTISRARAYIHHSRSLARIRLIFRDPHAVGHIFWVTLRRVSPGEYRTNGVAFPHCRRLVLGEGGGGRRRGKLTNAAPTSRSRESLLSKDDTE